MLAGKLRTLAGRTTVFGLSGVLSRVSGLITFPILTKSMGVEQFGVLDYYLTMTNLIAVVALFGLDSAANRFFFDSDDEGDRRRVLSQIFSLQLAPVLLLSCAGLVMLTIPGAAPAGGTISLLLVLVLWQAALMAPIALLQYLMIWRDQRAHYLVSTLGQTVLTMLVLLWVCIGRNAGATEVLAVFLGARLATLIHGLYVTRGQFMLTLDNHGLGAMVRYAWPTGLVCTLGAIMPFVERQSIVSIMTESDLGMYAAASRIGMLVLLPISAFQIVWVPFALSHFRDPAAESIYRIVLKLFAIGGLVVTLGLTATATPLLLLLTKAEFLGGRVAVFPICFGLVVKALGDIAQVGIDISRKSHLKLISFGLMAMLSLGLTPLLTRGFGVGGAAWATVIALAAKGVTEYRLAQSVHRIDWHGNRLLILAVMTCLFGLGAELAFRELGTIATALIGLAGAAAVASTGWIFVLDPHEREQTRALLLYRRGAGSRS